MECVAASGLVSGILLSSDGPNHNVIKLKPPMCFSRDDVDCMCSAFEQALIECEVWREQRTECQS